MTRVPELRFDGFEGEWENLNLSNITERITRKNNELISNLPLTISAELGLVNQLEYYNFRVASKDVSNYYLIYNGEFAYNKSTSKDAPFGAIKRLDRYEHGVLSTLYIAFKVKNSNSNFMKYYFETAIWNNHIYKISQEGARNHGLLNLNVSDFFDMPVNLPIITYEQEKIGELFSKIDQLIENQQELVDQTMDFKKSMLQKMFPKKDSLVPKFRFDGFSKNWCEIRLGNTYKVTMGQSPNSKNYTNDSQHMVLVQGNADLKHGKVYPRIYTTEITKIAKANSILMTVRAPVGELAINKCEVVIGRGVCSIEGNYFLYYLLENLNENYFWYKFTSGSTFESINSYDIKNAIIKIPTLEEQEKIGNFFKNLDEKIAREEKLLESYKDMKKSLLQKMFV